MLGIVDIRHYKTSFVTLIRSVKGVKYCWPNRDVCNNIDKETEVNTPITWVFSVFLAYEFFFCWPGKLYCTGVKTAIFLGDWTFFQVGLSILVVETENSEAVSQPPT